MSDIWRVAIWKGDVIDAVWSGSGSALFACRALEAAVRCTLPEGSLVMCTRPDLPNPVVCIRFAAGFWHYEYPSGDAATPHTALARARIRAEPPVPRSVRRRCKRRTPRVPDGW